ncbi:unnamed protein product [Durusdinium trenchii]|uniref:Uncharacterized protein n=1 Tax=Durusdinium trenchii TaxID=1381693 RepID=A0ABP0MFP5_9DINO
MARQGLQPSLLATGDASASQPVAQDLAMALAKRLISEENLGRAGLASSVYNGQAFIFGGHNGQKPLKTVESFRPLEDAKDPGEWKEVPAMLARRTYATACELEGKIYVVGGSADGRTLNTFEVLDPESNEWDQWFTKPPMGTKRTMHGAAVAGGRLYVSGGFDGIRDLASAEMYDPRSNSWSSSMDAMSVPRSYHVMVSTGDKVYAIGGQERQVKDEQKPRAHQSIEAFELYCERWLPMPPMSVGRIGAAATTFQDEQGDHLIYVTGGSDGDQVLSSGEVFNPRLETWQELPPMTVPRVGHCSFAIEGRVYVVGGMDGKVVLDTYEVFDLSEKSWSLPQHLGAERAGLASPGDPEDEPCDDL